MNKKPVKLQKCNAAQVLEQQLTITGKQLIIIFVLCVIFGIICFISKGPTYGVL